MGVRISFKTSFVSLIVKGINIHCRMETVWKRVMCEVKAPQDGAAVRAEVLPQRGADITLVFSLSIKFPSHDSPTSRQPKHPWLETFKLPSSAG